MLNGQFADAIGAYEAILKQDQHSGEARKGRYFCFLEFLALIWGFVLNEGGRLAGRLRG